MATYVCPACGNEDAGKQLKCACGADLALLQHLDAVADIWFNRALQAVDEGNTGRALEWMSASCAARPTDGAARRAQAKLWAQLGRWQEAKDALERARELDSLSAELEDLDQALQEAVTHAPTGASIAKAASPRSIKRRSPGSRSKRKSIRRIKRSQRTSRRQ